MVTSLGENKAVVANATALIGSALAASREQHRSDRKLDMLRWQPGHKPSNREASGVELGAEALASALSYRIINQRQSVQSPARRCIALARQQLQSPAAGSHWRIVTALALMLSGGCGLADYEAQMASAQKYADRLDDEASYLADPIELPMPKESADTTSPQPVQDLFLRPPHGIASKPEAGTRGDVLHRYGRAARQRSGPWSGSGSDDITVLEMDVGVHFGKDGEEFWKKVQQALGIQSATFTKVVKEPPGRPKLEFQTTTVTDKSTPPTSYFLYLIQGANIHIAIVYLVSQDKLANPETRKMIDKMIDLSLQSLAIGAEATRLRQRFQGGK
jgi:hypothetical protein